MKVYESVLVINVPHDERYRMHCRVESMIRDSFLGESVKGDLRHERGLVPAYSYMTAVKDDNHSMVVIRSAVQLGLPAEKEIDIKFQLGQRVRLKFMCCTETNRNTNGTTRCWEGEELTEFMAKPRLIKAGFDIESISIQGLERFQVNKKEHKSWFLQGAHVDAVVIVNDPVLAEKSVTDGISKKRSFGFGFVQWELL